ncbi:hypothetical protein ACWPM1_02265 [Tsuneonella sp. HG249]
MRCLALPLLALLAACGQGDAGPARGEPTAGEAKALAEAAEMLEERRPASPAAGRPEVATTGKGETQ